jgi:hypothetical protein
MLEKLTAFTKKVSDLSNKPALNPTELKAQFDAAPEELRQYLNKLIDALLKTSSGDSGAKNIGATTITGLTGNNVQIILENLFDWIKTNRFMGSYNYQPVLSGSNVTWSGQLYKKGTYYVTVTAKYNNDGNHMAIGTWLVKYEGGATNKIGTAELLGTVSKVGYATSLTISVNLNGLLTVNFVSSVSSTSQTINVNAVKIDDIRY